MSCLADEYLGDVVFIAKIKDLAGKYSHMRRTRPDGNCFFRAFAYAYMENLISNKDDYEQFRQLAEKSKDKLISLGFPKFTLEDFHETVRKYHLIYYYWAAKQNTYFFLLCAVYGGDKEIGSVGPVSE